ncbi:MAG: oxidoreductase [Candidatus Sericytochromatia bacterium]|nr:MAG: oxidoreductase [Candidatus Sericytochromatia bacterium]
MNKKSITLGLILVTLSLIFIKRANKKCNLLNNKGKYVLVTGASTGIGRSIVEKLALNDYIVFATARKDKDLENLSKIKNIIPIKMDLLDHNSVLQAKSEVKKQLNGNKLFSIINNAGIAIGGPIELIPMEELRKQFEVNFFGTVDVIQTFFSLLDEKHSKIINMSSVGGKVANPFMGPYNASKFALEAMSDSLRRELLNTNIDVIVIEPGRIVTPIWDKAEDIDPKKYKDSRYYEVLGRVKKFIISRGKLGAPPDKVSKKVIEILSNKNNKARYWVSSKPLIEVFIPKLLPDRVLDKVIKRFLKI